MSAEGLDSEATPSPEGISKAHSSNQPRAAISPRPTVCPHPSAPTPPVRPAELDSGLHNPEGNTEASGQTAGEGEGQSLELWPLRPAPSPGHLALGMNSHGEGKCTLDPAGLRVPHSLGSKPSTMFCAWPCDMLWNPLGLRSLLPMT